MLFENIICSKKFKDSIRYLSISRCMLSKGFGNPHLVSFLETNETLVMLSFVMNNSPSKPKALVGEDSKPERRKNIFKLSAPNAEELSQMGYKCDIEIL